MTLNALEQALGYVADRLKEASTWATIFAFLVLLGVPVPDTAAHVLTISGVAAAGLLGVLLREHRVDMAAVGEALSTVGDVLRQPAVEAAPASTSPQPGEQAAPAPAPAVAS